MPKTDDEIINEFIGKGAVPADRALARRFLWMIHLHAALLKTDEPQNTLVLATLDGRTLEISSSRQLCLDVGDSPTHWPHERGAELARQWNRNAASKDQVALVYWRDHYRSQIQRIEVIRARQAQQPAV